MPGNRTRKWLLSLVVVIALSLMTAPLHADQSQGFDFHKIKELTGTDQMSKADVKKLFGEPVSTAPIQKTEEGCVELWIYTEVIFEGAMPVKTEFLYVGFDEKGFVCSAEVTEEILE